MVLGAMENASAFQIAHEYLTGVHVEVLPQDQTSNARMIFPIFSGMTYVSARYSGSYFTPRVEEPWNFNFTGFEKVRNGVWNYWGTLRGQYRIYVLDEAGEFVGDDFDFGPDGHGNRPLNGWVRVARVNVPADVEILDAPAQAIVIGMEVEMDPFGVVRYQFQTAFEAPTASET